MKIEQQVTSLEISKRLKELGVKQGDWDNRTNLFYWSFYDGGANKNDPQIISHHEANFGFQEDLYSAFTVAELGEMLNEYVSKIDCGDSWYDMAGQREKPTVGWGGNNHEFVADTEADARGKMLIYLLENGLLDRKSVI